MNLDISQSNNLSDELSPILQGSESSPNETVEPDAVFNLPKPKHQSSWHIVPEVTSLETAQIPLLMYLLSNIANCKIKIKAAN